MPSGALETRLNRRKNELADRLPANPALDDVRHCEHLGQVTISPHPAAADAVAARGIERLQVLDVRGLCAARGSHCQI